MPRRIEPAIRLQFINEGLQECRIGVPDAQLVAHFTGLLRNRRLWRDVPETLKSMGRKCETLLRDLGLAESDGKLLASAGIIQVVIDPKLPESAREFPWECVLAEGTREIRAGSPYRRGGFGIVRHWPAPAQPRTPRSLLVVQSAPSTLGEVYDFDAERKIVCSSLGLGDPPPLTNPDLNELAAAIRARKPDVIHLAGVDGVEGAQLLRIPNLNPLEMPPGGMYFRGPEHPLLASFPELAKRLSCAAVKPCLVAFNIYNSADGAAAAVEAGATAAIGFQDEIDNAVAEQLFGAFYAEWKRCGWDVGEGFKRAWQRLRNYGARVRGSGVVLWSRLSLLPVERPEPAKPRRKRQIAPAEAKLEEKVVKTKEAANPRDHIGVIVKNAEALNYSLLHNGGRLFRAFKVSRLLPGIHTGVTVDVRLFAGPEVSEYHATFQLSDDCQSVDVADLVKVPLTPRLTRSLSESVYTTVSYCVSWGGEVIEQQTERVKLLPVDEWRDDDLNRKWLPSFVMPRDPAIRKIVDCGQRYLAALADDSGAGFDGYQSYDKTGATLDERCRYIDAQVRAIWWALVYDYGIGYINPPPTFEDYEQRLRTPSDIVNGRRGTCIDLALMFAACLEYIDIYPVIFLLRDHAFPGYWRSEAGYAELDKVSVNETSASVQPDGELGSWMFPASCYPAFIKLIQAGLLSPIETVQLTQRSSFSTAVDEGLQNLRSRRNFQSLYDVQRARRNKPPVTPLPLCTFGEGGNGERG